MRKNPDPFALVNVLVLGAVTTVILAVWVFADLGGWAYYATPLRVRGYAPQHPVLKPSGSVSHLLGLAGLVMMTMPVIYSVRKKWRRLANAGSLAAWLEVHIFCGMVGPMLVTFHTAFKFNGLISVAYWSMMLVMLSGFVGRYFYVRIPKTIRGAELTRDEIEARIASLAAHVAEAGLGPGMQARLNGPDAGRRWGRGRLRRALVRQGLADDVARDLTETLAERATLARRLHYLERTKALFAAWHVFHLPLVYVMFGIAVLHVGVALYLGYSFY
jgi:hypothetical protein